MNKVLHITDYAPDVHLYEAFLARPDENISKEELLDTLLVELNERYALSFSYADKRRFLRAKINTLPPNTLDMHSIAKLDLLLQNELPDKDIIDAEMLKQQSRQSIGATKLAVWQGDITTLKVDAIVNAANRQMLGCFQPLHACIDNAIHSAAGVQLRDDCHIIMQKQGFAEPTGTAKITRAYNLPSKFVLHTVGPIVQAEVSEQNKSDLAACYISCLEICNEIESIKSVAFCSISTGVFGYPPEQAAPLAFQTVSEWLEQNPDCLELVVFNVFSNNDLAIYKNVVKKI